MAEASAAVLGGFVLGTEAKTTRYPDRYRDPRGEAMGKRGQRPGSKTREADGVMKYRGFVIVPVIWWQELIRMRATGSTLWVALLLLDKARRAP